MIETSLLEQLAGFATYGTLSETARQLHTSPYPRKPFTAKNAGMKICIFPSLPTPLLLPAREFIWKI